MDIHHPVTRSIYEQPQEPMIRTPAPTIAQDPFAQPAYPLQPMPQLSEPSKVSSPILTQPMTQPIEPQQTQPLASQRAPQAQQPAMSKRPQEPKPTKHREEPDAYESYFDSMFRKHEAKRQDDIGDSIEQVYFQSEHPEGHLDTVYPYNNYESYYSEMFE